MEATSKPSFSIQNRKRYMQVDQVKVPNAKWEIYVRKKWFPDR